MKVFPAHLFAPGVVRARIAHNTISGGIALNGEEDVIVTDGGGRWEIEYSDIALDTTGLQRAWEAWLDHLAGGATECLVPLLSVETAPRPWQWDNPAKTTRLVADDDVFPESVGFAVPHIVAEVEANASLRATSLQITVTKGAPIKGGEKFSLGGHAYRIGLNVSGNEWKISPPLREAAEIGDPVNFDWPVVKCRMRPAADYSVPIELGAFGDAQISFVEAV